MGLHFDSTKYKIKSMIFQNTEVIYRAFEHIPYVEKPVIPEWQCLSIYVPEKYYEDGASLNGYTLTTAPIFFPNAVGGYKPGKECEPEIREDGRANSLFHGHTAI